MGTLGYLVGTTIAGALDPLLIVIAIVLTLTIRNLKILVPALAAGAVLLNWFIYEYNSAAGLHPTFNALTVVCKFFSFSLWAGAVSLIRAMLRNK